MDELPDDETLIILGESRVASPPVPPPMSARATPAFRPGMDIQGIPWERAHTTREEYRLQRMREYSLLEMRREPYIYIGEDLCLGEESTPQIFEFTYRNRAFPCTVQHFQLRHLLSSPSLSSVYYTYGGTVMEWNPIENIDHTRINVPPLVGAHSRISTLCATADLLIAGGFYGELIIRSTIFRSEEEEEEEGGDEADSIFHVRRVTNDDNGITNHITPCHDTFPERFLVSSNDSYVRMYDAKDDKVIPLIRRDVPINASKVSPSNGLVMAIASDSNNVEVIDLRTEQVVQSLTGHIGFSFSLDWNPSGTLLATGNEDHTCRIFDLRSPTSSLLVLGSRMAAVRNVRYSPDGHVLAVMEESDFVTFYDVPRDYRFSTTVDFFGETAGVDFTPDGEFCYIGCTEPNLGGVIELQRPEIKCLSGLIL